MKKTLIASAVAAATISSVSLTALAATPVGTAGDDPATMLAEMLDKMPKFYGNIQLVHLSTDIDAESGGADETTHEFQDNGSTFGLTHEHAITEDITGFLKAEWEFNADDKEEEGGISRTDETYIGVKGGFGSAQIGSDDTVYEWVDFMDMYEAVGLEGDLAVQKEGDNFQYYSPEIADGLVLGVTIPFDSDTDFGGAFAATYSIDNLTVAAAYGLGRDETIDAGDSFGIAASFAIEDFTIMAQYETKDEDGNAGNDTDYYAIMGQYSMGASNFALGYQSKDDDSVDEEEAKIYLQALHNLSDQMYVYLEYVNTTDLDGIDGRDQDELAVGATYAF